MQIDLVPGLTPSGGIKEAVTDVDMFYGEEFAKPTTSQDSKQQPES